MVTIALWISLIDFTGKISLMGENAWIHYQENVKQL